MGCMFCTRCGKCKVVKETIDVEHCPLCGSEMPEDAQVCPKCGAPHIVMPGKSGATQGPSSRKLPSS